MKKKLLFLLTFLLCGLLTAVSAQDLSSFRVQFSVVGATCYNNGKVVYALTDGAGKALDSLPPGLSQVRAYYKLTPADSAHYSGWYYSGGTDTLTVNYGTYTVGVEALLADGAGGYMRVDTETVLTITTSYQKPTASIVNVGSSGDAYGAGTFYTVPCMDIGRVQLRILYGQFPYTVVVSDADSGDTLRTEVFTGRQYSGTKEYHYDFRDYYTIDSLPAGNWSFRVEDGCGYGLPQVVETVQMQNLPRPYSFAIMASSGNFSDSNVVRMTITYYNSVTRIAKLMHQHVSYRLVYDGLMTGEWHPMPYDSLISFRYYLFDTAFSADKYCDLWDRNITFEYKVSGCGYENESRVFQYRRPNGIYFEKDSSDVVDSVLMDPGNCVRNRYWHRDRYGIRYYKRDLQEAQYQPEHISTANDHEFYRYHYTHPLTWVYTDVRTGTVVKRDTLSIITDKSSLTDEEVGAVYALSDDSALVIPMERKLLDGKGCELYVSLDTFRFMHRISSDSICWQVEYKDNGKECCTVPRWVRVYQVADFGNITDGTVIRLTRSPYQNFYNFEAVYHAADKSWTVVRENPGNTAAITGNINGRGLYISDYCLPSGPYVFEITTACGTARASRNVAFGNNKEMQVAEEIVCVSSRDCGNLYIDYPQGAYRWMSTNTSPETGLPLDTVYQKVVMKATVIDAPIASLKGKEDYMRPHFTFSLPGTYVLRICPNLALNECSSGVCHYDTFHLDAATVEFVEALAVVCDTASTEGSAWVRADRGMPPYTYTLYDQPDKLGNILAVNHTGVFPNVPMHSDQTLSCLVQDSCMAYFHVNFQPTAMAELQKLWFDGGLTATETCEGTTIQIHALAVGDIWQYEWTGPNGFHSTSPDPYVFVPRGNGDGWYRVSIRQTSCAGELSDSIYLTVLPAPRLTLSPDTTVCPGEVLELRFTPHSDAASGDIPFSVAFANAGGIQVRQYSAAAGVTVTDTFSTLSPAKIYPVGIRDDRCDYRLADPEDTLRILLRTDVSPLSRLVTTFDTVCYDGEARLSARAVDTMPYIIRWYGDYNQKRMLKAETMADTGRWSHYDTASIQHRTLLYVSLQRGGECPSVHGLLDGGVWSGAGETAPGIAIADVWDGGNIIYRDEVCQSQTLGYDDPYGVIPGVVDAETIGRAMRKAGNYYFSKTFSSADGYGCDSTVVFHLTVSPPPMTELAATVTRQAGFFWHDSLYTESGRYAVLSAASGGCDRLDVLNLTVLDVANTEGEICGGDSVTLRVAASLSGATYGDEAIPRRARPGDVLCTDGSLLPADSFPGSGKTPMGVVFQVDETGIHGRAVSLFETSRIFSYSSTPFFIMSQSYEDAPSALSDDDGEANTLHMKAVNDAYAGVDFATDSTAASYCYYFNPNTLTTDRTHHGWYLPSFGELTVLQSNVWEVNRTLNRLCQLNSAYKTFSSDNYWSSTYRDANYAWVYTSTSWGLYRFSQNNGVRPVTKF